MLLLSVVAASILGGVISVVLAASVSLTWLPRLADRLVAFSVGLLLTFAFTDLIPEAVHQGLGLETVGFVLMAGLLGFFMLEKAALLRHDHRHEIGLPSHPPRVALIVLGDGLHNFSDGVLIAAAFLTDPALGWTTAAAVFAHEVPQEISDFILLIASGLTRARALALNAVSGLATVLGGVLGYAALKNAEAAVPYVLVLSAASFIYIAMVNLVPELHKNRKLSEALPQAALLILGVLVVTAIGHMLPHDH